MLLSEPIPPVFSSTVEQVRFVMVTRRDPSEPLVSASAKQFEAIKRYVGVINSCCNTLCNVMEVDIIYTLTPVANELFFVSFCRKRLLTLTLALIS